MELGPWEGLENGRRVGGGGDPHVVELGESPRAGTRLEGAAAACGGGRGRRRRGGAERGGRWRPHGELTVGRQEHDCTWRAFTRLSGVGRFLLNMSAQPCQVRQPPPARGERSNTTFDLLLSRPPISFSFLSPTLQSLSCSSSASLSPSHHLIPSCTSRVTSLPSHLHLGKS